jgi:hypothetical protein
MEEHVEVKPENLANLQTLFSHILQQTICQIARIYAVQIQLVMQFRIFQVQRTVPYLRKNPYILAKHLYKMKSVTRKIEQLKF